MSGLIVRTARGDRTYGGAGRGTPGGDGGSATRRFAVPDRGVEPVRGAWAGLSAPHRVATGDKDARSRCVRSHDGALIRIPRPAWNRSNTCRGSAAETALWEWPDGS
ncbi:hypothetical protein GCM10018785_08550 [Streptomyces longispororuber]|uniref:Uncharacterized protein n=1 Tax=Streptomyces longispororuber TaxID=68230 RepID=A0A918Z837_9ACTN|nr:hypothetical protein GCM10018785_08550 [Streptomyces longispororuber]